MVSNKTVDRHNFKNKYFQGSACKYLQNPQKFLSLKISHPMVTDNWKWFNNIMIAHFVTMEKTSKDSITECLYSSI